MRVQNPWCAIVVAGLLAGCAVGQDYQTPDTVSPVAFLTQPAEGTGVRRRKPRPLAMVADVARPATGSAGGGVGTGSDETKGRASQTLSRPTTPQDAEWEIDVFGKIARRVESQTYTAEALKAARDWVYVVIAADVSRVYFDLRAQQERLRILNSEVVVARVGASTHLQFASGYSPISTAIE